ncbi:MAG: hypothetical protein GY859_24245, partial [Desulfobacterales bacterium]|nr:hypothetical protein [Desulfobacterales bacterium]
EIQARDFRAELMARKKEYLKSQVQTTMSVLEKAYKDAHDPENLKTIYKELLQNEVNTAFSLLQAIEAEAGVDPAEKRQKAMALIKALRYGPENKDYFWINDMHPTMVMHPYKPQLDGKDLSGVKDPNGKKLFVEMVKACGENGEGFVDYFWPKYGADKPQPKLSFVKLFKPWNWVIGSGVYIEVAEKKLMSDSARLIKALRYGPENKDYFWINDMHPTMVMHPYKPQLDGKDLSGVADPNGKKLFVEMARACRENGEGFVDYFWPKYGADQPQPKLSFVKVFKPWNWIIGTGLYVDDIDATTAVKRAGLEKKIAATTDEVEARIEARRSETRSNMRRVLISVFVVTAIVLAITLTAVFFLTRKNISRPVERIIEGMEESAHLLVGSAGQISAAGHTLAQSSSEQAASIEETSASLEEMSSMTGRNADNANQANHLMKEANRVVERANASMVELTGSMDEITRASEETSKIVKTIDEIAFQTNLLALNAAVEAARAGEAGAGFAVVADEVRNLAMRAAEAAKNTSGLIEETVRKIGDGSSLVAGANEAFTNVADSASKVGGLLEEIAAASNEQSRGVQQVNTAVSQMDKVTLQNAATAEESASAATEMNSQAERIKGMIQKLTTMIEGGGEASGGGSV